jgi:hypothetical protein
MEDDTWTPEQGDDAWLPDVTRTVESYSDAELRFSPLYRRVKERMTKLPWPPSEADILQTTREMLQETLPDDETREDLLASLAPEE